MSRRKKRRYQPEPERFELPPLNPETKRGIAIIFFFAAAALLLLSFFQIAGTVGLVLDNLMAKGFGLDRILVPFLFVILGFSLLFPERSKMGPWNYLGTLFFFLSFNGLINLLWIKNPRPSWEELATTGGLVGQLFGTTLNKAAGFWAALLILSALLLISIILSLNTSLRSLLGLHRHLTGWFG
jgi:hypothetical protein